MKLTTISLNNLKRRKGKTVFLCLGLLIGVATVVTLFSITRAMRADIDRKLDRYGVSIVVVPKSEELALSYGGITVAGFSVPKDLKEADLARVRSIEDRETIGTISPKLLVGIEANGRKALMVGVRFRDELRLKKWWELIGGRPQTGRDLVLGNEAAEKLERRAGEEISIGGQKFRVAAVLRETGSQDDNLVFADLAAAQALAGKGGRISMAEISGEFQGKGIETVAAQIEKQLPDARAAKFSATAGGREKTLDIFGRFALTLSTVVLLIGMLIVAITMMSSVNERTMEIGIFRAIGFRGRHVMKIILFEAAVASAAAGLGGWLLGVAAAGILAPRLAGVEVGVNWNPLLAAGSIALATTLGVLASVYPARKAAALDPTEALRAI